MGDVAAIRQAMATNLQAITNWQFSPYQLANPTLPGGHVFPGDIDYDKALQRGRDIHVMTIEVFVSDAAGDIGQQQNLDEYLAGSGARSIKEQLEAEPTLGGACEDLRVTGCTGYRRVLIEGRTPALIAQWRVEVCTIG